MAATKINDYHKEVLCNQVAEFNTSPTQLAEWFQDKENAERYGFEPVSVSIPRIFQLIKKIDPNLIHEKRQAYLANFDDIPLSYKKMRVVELAKLYAAAKGMTAKQSILRDIHNEMGENIEKMRDVTNILILNTQERFDERLQRALDIGSHVIGQPTQPS